MPWLPNAPIVETATFTVLRGKDQRGTKFKVQFNPASMEYTLANEMDPRNGSSSGARQFVKKTSAKLTMTLIFDTTTTAGTSVLDITTNIAALIAPARRGPPRVPPKVEFAWGCYTFVGVVEQYKETIDFFSAEGVPLRSSINLTLASQEVEFKSNRSPSPSVDRQRPEPVVVPPGLAPKDAADRAADPRAARGIALASGAISLRMGAGVSLSIGGQISLGAAAGFAAAVPASGGAGFSAGDGAGFGGRVGLSAGGSLAAGLQATAGAAFTGLRLPSAAPAISAEAARAALLPAPASAAGAIFGPGGRALTSAGASLSADVAAGRPTGTRIRFGG